VFKRAKYFNGGLGKRIQKTMETMVRIILFLLIPTLVSAPATAFWYFFIWKKDIHFPLEMETIVTCAWLASFVFFYGLIASVIFGRAYDEYKDMRMSVKRHDLDNFINLADEEVSLLAYILLFVLSFSVWISFACLQYPSLCYGFVLVASISYVLTLVFFVIGEIDNPCAGFWYIKSIPDEWLYINPKEYRKERRERIKKELEEKEALWQKKQKEKKIIILLSEN